MNEPSRAEESAACQCVSQGIRSEWSNLNTPEYFQAGLAGWRTSLGRLASSPGFDLQSMEILVIANRWAAQYMRCVFTRVRATECTSPVEAPCFIYCLWEVTNRLRNGISHALFKWRKPWAMRS